MARMISNASREQVRAANDIVEVIGAVLPLKRSGPSFVGLCPFHKEKTPSFNVNPQRQLFHCFGCGKGGDIFTFIQEYESLSFMEALKRLADRAHIVLEEVEGEDRPEKFLKDRLLQLHEAAAKRWNELLLRDDGAGVAREYLKGRKVSQESVAAFRLGYSRDSWDDTLNWARAQGYNLEELEKSGLVIAKEGERGRYYDRFRGRLMFPICDDQGRVIGFSGRILSGDEKTAKYVNSPETPIFSKSRVFFGLDKGKRPVLDAGRVIVCEGQLDLIACHAAGVRNVVAPQGTAFTSEHARILKRFAEEAVLCFDSDTAGRKAAVRVLDSLLGSGLSIRVMRMPPGHDPDSFIREEGAEAFVKLVEGAPGFFDWYLEELCGQADLGADRGRLAVVSQMGEAVRKTGNAVLLDKYSQKTALRLGVSAEAIRAEFRKVRVKPPVEEEPSLEEEASEGLEEVQRPIPQMELWLLRLVLLHAELAGWVGSHLDLQWVRHPSARRILEARLSLGEGGEDPARILGAVLDQLADPMDRAVLTGIGAENREIPNPGQQVEDLVRRLRNEEADRQMQEISRRLVVASEAEEVRDLLERQGELRKLKRLPLVAIGDA